MDRQQRSREELDGVVEEVVGERSGEAKLDAGSRKWWFVPGKISHAMKVQVTGKVSQRAENCSLVR